MAEETSSGTPHGLQRIVVRLRTGKDRMSASDDPLFLGLRGPGGREFRLELAQGTALRKGAEDVFVLAGDADPETNVARPALNDPARPPIDASRIGAVVLRKGLDPIPNVRGRGEFDDRLELADAEVELHTADRPKPRRFTLGGPVWLGLVCGLSVELVGDEDS